MNPSFMLSKRQLRSAALPIFVVVAIAIAFLNGRRLPENDVETIWSHRLLVSSTPNNDTTPLKPYNIDTILSTFDYIQNSRPLLLIWDGFTFASYNMRPKQAPFKDFHGAGRYVHTTPLLAHALLENFPERFKPGSTPFQIIWSGDDYLGGKCVNDDASCPSDQFAPILMFGSVPQNVETLMPSVKAFPNPYYANCIYRYKLEGAKTCKWQPVNDVLKYEDLKRQIFWRGSDFSNYLVDYTPWYRKKGALINNMFSPSKIKKLGKQEIVDKLCKDYNNLPPRWHAVALTLRTQVRNEDPDKTWINTLFSNKGIFNRDIHAGFKAKGLKVTDDPVSSFEMSKYAYQIDLSGGGGTTWEGTITKLLMPGVLFHHQTPFKDWFYDDLLPWIHYIPVKSDLSNLYRQYLWAEQHPKDCAEISARATKFAKHLLSQEYMDHIFEKLYVNFVGEAVKAFDAQGMNWEQMVQYYDKHGIQLQPISRCDYHQCVTELQENRFNTKSIKAKL